MFKLFKCKHNPNKEDTTVKIDTSRLTMVPPTIYHGICTCCKKRFMFVRENGKYKDFSD